MTQVKYKGGVLILTLLRRSAALGVVLLAALFSAAVYGRYRADLRAERARVASGSEVAQTACGPIEFASLGSGPAVLLVHGAGGGFDQGLEMAAELAQRGFRAVTMSRFGYLRTPVPREATAAAQADAHACLLDALNIERAAIVGVSAGAPSSMQFALRHPQRCTAMLLLVPLAYAPRASEQAPAPLPGATRFMLETALGSDFLYWLSINLFPATVIRTVLATPPDAVAQAGPAEQARVRRLMQRILPISARQQGLMNDAAAASTLQRYDLERISVPTLVVSLKDDLYGTFESAGYTAANIPGARFIAYMDGGHVWAGHHADLLAATTGFLQPQRAPTDAPISRR